MPLSDHQLCAERRHRDADQTRLRDEAEHTVRNGGVPGFARRAGNVAWPVRLRRSLRL
jgi:hypothetical protein